MMHDESINIYDHTEREAERAVRSVAPRVLGVSPNNLRCSQPVPDEEHQSDYQIRRSASYSTSDSSTDHDDEDKADSDAADDQVPDGNSSGQESSEGPTDDSHGDTGPMCRGALRPISEAHRFLDDDDWVDDALFAEQLQRELNEWKATLDLDRPPPVADVWAD
jgi:hypothetical protein